MMIKKLLLLVLIGGAAGSIAHAQGGNLSSKDYGTGLGMSDNGTESRNTGFGIKGGYNLSSLSGSGANALPNRNSLNAFHGGLYSQFGFSEFASLQVELLYIRKGFRAGPTTALATTGGTTTVSASYNHFHYLEIPVLFVGNFTETLSFHVGPQVSVLTAVTADGEELDLDTYGYKTLDYGAVAGVEARLGPARLGVRYDLGLGQIYKKDTVVKYNQMPLSATGISDTNIHNQAFQVYVGIGIQQ